MSSRTSYRLSGIALLVGSLLAGIYYVLQAFLPGTDVQTILSPMSVISSYVGLVGSVLLLLGLPGMYARQSERAGILGLLGFLFLWYITLMQGVILPFTNVTIISLITAHIASPSLAATPPPAWGPFFMLSMVSQVIGIPLLAVATLRARVFPRWIGWALLATLVVGVASMLPFVPQAVGNLAAIIASIGTAGYGFALLGAQHLERMQPVVTSTEAAAQA